MTTNAGLLYGKAQAKFSSATTADEKLKALQDMLRECPKHKSSESLQKEIKTKIAKYKDLIKKEKQSKKSGKSLVIKKEGAAQICIIGITNTGKSTLLKNLTNSKVEIAAYPFTTKKPEVATMDYHGIKIQIIEIPALTPNTYSQPDGPSNLSIIRQCDLIILTSKTKEDIKLVLNELKENDIARDYILYENQTNIKDLIWTKLKLIKIFTKQPGKKPAYPPVAFKRNSKIYDLAQRIHKDFVRKYKNPWARVWGKSSVFPGQKFSFDHVMEDNDIVELHFR